MMIPDADKENNDFIDFLTDACKKQVPVIQNDGTILLEQQLDWKKIYYKTQIVSSNTFSRFVYELEMLEGMALDCYNHMTAERAKVFYDQIMSYVDALRYSIDAKSSEMVRDKDNTQNNLANLLTRVRVERHYSAREDLQKGFMSGVFGDKNKDDNTPR